MATVAFYGSPSDSRGIESDTLCRQCWRIHRETYVGDRTESVELADPDSTSGGGCHYCGAIREPESDPRIFPEWNRSGSKTGRFRILDNAGPTGAIFPDEQSARLWVIQWRA